MDHLLNFQVKKVPVKLLLSLQALVQATKKKENVLFVDTEHSLNLQYCLDLGMDKKYFFYKQPNNAEEALDFIKEVASMNLFKVIVLDSIGGLVSKEEMKDSVQDKSVALVARLLSKWLPSVIPIFNANKILMLFVNQQRAKLSGFSGFGGIAKTTMGGSSLKYFASLRLEIRRKGWIKKKFIWF